MKMVTVQIKAHSEVSPSAVDMHGAFVENETTRISTIAVHSHMSIQMSQETECTRTALGHSYLLRNTADACLHDH
jgi:hypothetical protein